MQKGESLSKDNTLFGLGLLFEECKEWTFDFALIAFAQEKPPISFIALYSHVKNLKSLRSIPVTNLQIYLKDTRPVSLHVEINKEESTLRKSL